MKKRLDFSQMADENPYLLGFMEVLGDEALDPRNHPDDREESLIIFAAAADIAYRDGNLQSDPHELVALLVDDFNQQVHSQ